MKPNIINIASVDSTNTYLRAMPTETPDMTVVATTDQTAGRGQRGNRWESARGENVTLSMLFRPGGIRPAAQFGISRATALAVADTVVWLLGGSDDGRVMVKWSNDIYVDDKKIAGILIEHSISGDSISRTIIGIGLNVNQTEFVSDAPNPVSARMLTGREYDLPTVTQRLVTALAERLEAERESCGTASGEEYRRRLWRGKGYHPYRVTASGERFMAEIAGVDPTGMLSLRREDGGVERYSFKEVSSII